MKTTLAVVVCYLAIGLGLSTIAGCTVETNTGPENTEADHDHDDHDHDHDHDDDHDGNHDHHDEGDDHDHDHDGDHAGHADSMPDAIALVTEMMGKVKTQMEADDMEGADTTVHQMGHVLGDLERLAAGDTFSGETKEQAKAAVSKVFDAVSALHETLEGEEGGKTLEEVMPDFNDGIKTLGELAK